MAAGRAADAPGTLIVGHDCRRDAHAYAQLAAQVAAAHGFDVKLTQDYCPTPALCWSVAHDEDAVGGIMLTSSHNPAEYLGVKLRMADGGASPKEFTDRVEAQLPDQPTQARGSFREVDLMTRIWPRSGIWWTRRPSAPPICAWWWIRCTARAAGIWRGFCATWAWRCARSTTPAIPRSTGCIPSPSPRGSIGAWRRCASWATMRCSSTMVTPTAFPQATSTAIFVNPHRVITLLVQHMVEDRHENGRVVSTITASAMLDRMCRRLGLELVSTPVGFKWIYGEMEKGGVMIGGEESGGIGLPGHVKERDGLLMALLTLDRVFSAA